MDIGHIAPTNVNLIFPAAHGARSGNLAMNAFLWSANNHTHNPPSKAVDGDIGTLTIIYVTTSWPFLAVDLGCKYMVETVAGRLGTCECLIG